MYIRTLIHIIMIPHCYTTSTSYQDSSLHSFIALISVQKLLFITNVNLPRTWLPSVQTCTYTMRDGRFRNSCACGDQVEMVVGESSAPKHGTLSPVFGQSWAEIGVQRQLTFRCTMTIVTLIAQATGGRTTWTDCCLRRNARRGAVASNWPMTAGTRIGQFNGKCTRNRLWRAAMDSRVPPEGV